MKTLRVYQKDTDTIREVPWGSKAGDILQAAEPPDLPWTAASADNEIISLNDPVTEEVELRPVSLGETAGTRIYRQSLCFLLEIALRRLAPQQKITLEHTLGHAFWYHLPGAQGGKEFFKTLETAMGEIVQEDIPVSPQSLTWRRAIEYFRSQDLLETTILLEGLNNRVVPVWECAGQITLRHQVLVPRTGLLETFAVEPYKEGILLRYPPSSTPRTMGPRDDEPLIFETLQKHKKWGKGLQIHSVGRLNLLAVNRAKVKEFIQASEILHERKISAIAETMANRDNRIKAVFIAGPSSSGKTTFTKRLALYLRSTGLLPEFISLDNYYLNRADVPRDSQGEPDLESLYSLDISLFNKNLQSLFAGKKTELPLFNFKRQERMKKGLMMELQRDGILLIEGIHGLNPALISGIEENAIFRIYISALTQLNIDDHARISTTDNRLLRRIVRDHQFRLFQTRETLEIWPSVRRGEERHIFPSQNTADTVFNSALDYELGILKVFADPLLRTVPPDAGVYGEACRLLSFLRNFYPLPAEEVPEFSLLREFIGRSGFKY